MKLTVAIVRPEKLNDVLEALFDASVRGISVTTIDALLAAARTGDVGDGKIFVLPVEHVYRIRTGEQDELSVTPEPRRGEVQPDPDGN